MACNSELTFDVSPISIGVESRDVTIKFSQPVLDVYHLLTGRLVVDFKHKIDDVSPLFTLDSNVSAGHFIRSGPFAADADACVASITFVIPATMTSLITKGTILFDILCYDGATKLAVPGQWSWPCKRRITERA